MSRHCDVPAMMSAPLMMLGLALVTVVASAAPAQFYDGSSEEIVVPQKRAALVLDRILIALQKALREEPRAKMQESGPRVSALRVPHADTYDMIPVPTSQPGISHTSPLQRRGQAGAAGRGRVLRCYFNAVTCF